MRNSLLLLLLLGAATVFAQEMAPPPCLQKPAAERPYNKDRLIAMVKEQTPIRAGFLIRQCGVSVPWSEGLEAELRAAGAADGVIQALRATTGGGKTVTPPPVKPTVPAGPKPGEIRTSSLSGLPYAYIPPGPFMLGCREDQSVYGCEADEIPSHPIRITKGYWMGKTEVTVGSFKKYTKATGAAMPQEPKFGQRNLNPGWAQDDLPLTMVTWPEAQAFCLWQGMRLPSEAEWEYAARGPASSAPQELSTIAWFGDNAGQSKLDSQALRDQDPRNFIGKLLNNGNALHPVGQKAPNGWGLQDMLGNAWEWTNDWYSETAYKSGDGDDPKGPASGTHHVLRGGSFVNIPSYVKVSKRLKGIPTTPIFTNGFRCVGYTLK